MEIQSEPAQLRVLPFATVHITAVVPSQQGPSEKENDGTRARLLEGTTAQTRIVSLLYPPLILKG